MENKNINILYVRSKHTLRQMVDDMKEANIVEITRILPNFGSNTVLIQANVAWTYIM